LPGFEVNNWFALVVPAKTPRPIINRLNREVVAILGLTEVKDSLIAQGLEASPSTPDALRVYMESEFRKWAQVVAEERLTAQ
jgi:tripartite-type tricarboxylate transporter receptor subunit TctC